MNYSSDLSSFRKNHSKVLNEHITMTITHAKESGNPRIKGVAELKIG
jgi:hypothetical protein